MPLYPGAPICCNESWTSIYKFSISHQLTDSATQELLSLINSHCPMPNSCPQTVYMLKKRMQPIQCTHHQYCSFCMESVPLQEKCCGNCVDKKSQLCYFTIMPFKEQLKEIFSGVCACNCILHFYTLMYLLLQRIGTKYNILSQDMQSQAYTKILLMGNATKGNLDQGNISL